MFCLLPIPTPSPTPPHPLYNVHPIVCKTPVWTNYIDKSSSGGADKGLQADKAACKAACFAAGETACYGVDMATEGGQIRCYFFESPITGEPGRDSAGVTHAVLTTRCPTGQSAPETKHLYSVYETNLSSQTTTACTKLTFAAKT